ncbi:hypothetical protein [Microbulbifer sp. S227A]|uniref:hypothetical protein n=1 Tax=Microbulbifer sp. S227A TaxID=3415131 RepID=UPI003C7E5F6D
MSDDAASPAPLSDGELRETLERLGNLVLDMNDYVQEQTKAVNHATTAANEARRAAKATQDQTDPDQYAEYAVEVIDKRLEERMKDIRQTASDLIKASSYTREVLSKADQDRTDVQRQLWEREQNLDQFKSRLPLFGLGAVVLALVLTVLFPRFLASYGPTCGVLGGVWTTTTTGVDACVFYKK